MLSLWITTLMSFNGAWNIRLVSITSNALFMSVAQSIVIFGPIDHVGWCKASFGVTCASWSGDRSLNAPPDAVMKYLLGFDVSPIRHCQSALGSESTGIMLPPCFLSSFFRWSPAITIASLFESATDLPTDNAAAAAGSPSMPAVACIRRSTSV